MTLTVEQRIEKAHVSLMRHPQFVAYSGLLMVGDVKVSDDIPTAYTNGRDVIYGRKFVETLTDEQLRGVVLHENKHKMYRHIDTWYHLFKQNPQKCNMACDYVINLEIVDESKQSSDFVQLPKGGLYSEKYRGMNTYEVFNLLPDPPNGDGGGSGSGGFDEHGWEDGHSLNATELDELRKEIDSAIRQGAILAGKVGGDVNRSFEELMSAKVDWKTALREFVNATCQGKDESTWKRPNRRWLQQDVYLPSSYSVKVGRVVVAIDTSGSIGGWILTRFISELVAIMDNVKPEQIDLLYWDTAIASHEVYSGDNSDAMKSSTKPKGGGGTSPSCIPQYINKNKIEASCAIVLTDGFVGGDWGQNWNCPVLWCIVGGCDATPSVGQKINVKD